jgi:ribose 5-phosphate isomerase B
MYSGKVYLASDHAGIVLKEYIQDRLSEKGAQVIDLGAHDLDLHDDYPEIIRPAAEKVAEDNHSKAIIFGLSGQGEAIVANRVRHVRAVVYTGGDLEIVKLGRLHNNANILSIGAKFVTPELAWEAVHLFLDTAFPGDDRHQRRIRAIDE